jgi:uridine kinase
VRSVLALLGERTARLGHDATKNVLRPPAVVGVDGPSGSGKSTLSEAICSVARSGSSGALRVHVLHTDELLDGWDGLDTMAPALVAQVLARLPERRVLQHRRYDWHAKRFGAPRPVPVCDLLVVEGVGAGDLAVAPWLDLLVWTDAEPELRRRRALARDGDDYAPWYEFWARQEAEHHRRQRTRERADLRFTT